MREEIYRLLSPPLRGTPRYRAMTAAKEIIDWLLLAMAILLIARACGGFNPADGSMDDHFITTFSLLFAARFIIGPVVWLLKKLVGTGSNDGQDI